MNDILVILILLVLGALAAWSCLRRKNGGCGGACGGCGGGCGGCGEGGGCGSTCKGCHDDRDNKTQE